MLEIHPTKDRESYKFLSDKCETGFEGLKIVEAYDKSEVIGYGAYYYSEDGLVIVDAEAHGDKYLYDGIIRTMLFLASVDGIDKAELKLDDLSTAQLLGFVQNNSNYIPSIDEFMNSCKNCGNFR